MSKQALMVVDLQVCMLDCEWESPSAKLVIPAWQARIDKARAEGQTIVWVQNDGEEGYFDAPGAPGWKLYFDPADGERVVRKDVGDVFESNPLLADELKAQGIDSIEMVGMQSEMCITASAKGAKAAGFDVVVPADLHATFDAEDKDHSVIIAEVNAALAAEGIRS